jgi:hypothetical protein
LRGKATKIKIRSKGGPRAEEPSLLPQFIYKEENLTLFSARERNFKIAKAPQTRA